MDDPFSTETEHKNAAAFPLTAALLATAPAHATHGVPMSDIGHPSTPASIREATMEPDGTIVLHLRTTGPDAVGEAVSRTTPDNPHYKAIRDHLPNLKLGHRVPVPPFNEP